jgi:hypothetical protein
VPTIFLIVTSVDFTMNSFTYVTVI